MKWPHRTCFILCLSTLYLGGCSTLSTKDGPPRHPINLSKIKEPTPKYEPKSRYGNPKSYVALGKRYYVLPSTKNYNKRGIASWYGRKFHGQLTSNREPYNMLAMTAASPVLPIPCYVRVTNLNNGRSVIVRVNDRGPFAPNRIIDLSYAAARKLGYAKQGTALVQVTTIDTEHPNKSEPILASHTPQLYLQVGAFTNFYNAKRLKSHLLTYTQKPIKITPSKEGFRILYRVRIGPLIGVGESDRLYNTLHKHGLRSAITVIS